MSDPNLISMLMRGASGIYLHEATIRLLDRHGYWLQREDFLRYVVVDRERNYASIDFDAAMGALDFGDLDADEEASKILRIAASISGVYSVYLREVIEGIDPENIKHVAEAIMYADGFLNSVAHPIS